MDCSLRLASLVAATGLLAGTGCQRDQADTPADPAPSSSRIRFTDVTAGSGLEWTGPSYTASVADADRDGWPDVALSRHRVLQLHMNRQGRFDSHELTRGDLHGVSWLDWNHDGWPDLYVSRGNERGRGPGQGNSLFLNERGSLREEALDGPALNSGGRGRSATPWDLDGDGLLDIFLLNFQTGQKLIPGADRSRDEAAAIGWVDIPR